MEQISKRTYSPYSGKKGFCLIEGESGRLYPGVRIENSSFPLTITAMQAAISSCLAESDYPLSYYHSESEPELADYWISEYSIKKNKETFNTNNLNLFNPFKTEIPDISDTLKKLCKKAVTPNSDFSVAAVLETDLGYVTGVNIEGSTWSLGLCAERVALARAVAAGADNFLSMHIMAPKSDFCSPCGACRQVIHEFMPKKQIHLYHSDKQKTVHYAEHLLPHAFTAKSL